ncbi:Sensor histidine kinase RcsC [Pseudomonas sp. MM221]|nr:Sensor histidine kinase RcsC [Pseudomonas sp. MM221]
MLSHTIAKLLIVDDLPENLLALDALIQGEDREVHQAESADAALSLLLEHEFALAILDVQMPGMNGFELAELMRGTEKTRNIPIVFVTAAGREMNYAFKGYESGAVDFLYKPLDTLAVKSKVSVFVDLYRQRKVLDRQLQALERSRQEQELLLAQLQVARGELEHAVRMRDDFMSIVSHEVRTPLNGLILETQLRKLHLARGNLAAFSEDKLQAMVERDERQINSLIRLIEDMLDVSRIRTGKLSLRPKAFDLCQLVRGLVENFALRPRHWTRISNCNAASQCRASGTNFVLNKWWPTCCPMPCVMVNASRCKCACTSRVAWRACRCRTRASALARPTSSASSSSSSGSPPSRPVAGWGWGCIYRNRLSRRMAGAYRWKVKRAKAPPSPCNCRWLHSNNKTTRRGQPLRKPGV